MRYNLAILIALILALTAFTSLAFAGNPLEEDKQYFKRDFDLDGLETWEEFILGTDPFNSDSDNDGLPDGWERDYRDFGMDPSDSSDAHEDLDHDPVSNGTGFNVGERDAEFLAVQKNMDVWPSDKDITFKEAVFNEEGPHYDNYEEYYRPYTDLGNENLIRYMHTDPTKPDTDGDGILDPDDFEPLGWRNDGTSAGGADIVDVNTEIDPDIKLESGSQNVVNVEPDISDSTITSDYDINIDQSATDAQPAVKEPESAFLADADNDGI